MHVAQKTPYFLDLGKVLVQSALFNELPFLRTILTPLPFFKGISECRTRINKYGRESIAKYKKSLAMDPDQTTPTFFARPLQSKGISDKAIELEAANMIIAGSDTTANTLTYLIWAILKHPEVHARVVKEIATLPASFTTEDIAVQLPYLNWTIEECLRLYSAVPSSLTRVVPTGGRELAGHFVPEGTVVSAQAYTLHRIGAVFKDPSRSVWLLL